MKRFNLFTIFPLSGQSLSPSLVFIELFGGLKESANADHSEF